MSILIKGMDFPKTCMACDLEIVDDEDYTTYCPLIYKGYTGKCREDGRLPDCPLVEAAEVQDAVSRQAAIDAINSRFGFNIEEEYGSAVQEVINGLPSAQPEIIRCKDCMYFDKGWCNLDTSMGMSDFCSRAKRRTDE